MNITIDETTPISRCHYLNRGFLNSDKEKKNHAQSLSFEKRYSNRCWKATNSQNHQENDYGLRCRDHFLDVRLYEPAYFDVVLLGGVGHVAEPLKTRGNITVQIPPVRFIYEEGDDVTPRWIFMHLVEKSKKEKKNYIIVMLKFQNYHI